MCSPVIPCVTQISVYTIGYWNIGKISYQYNNNTVLTWSYQLPSIAPLPNNSFLCCFPLILFRTSFVRIFSLEDCMQLLSCCFLLSFLISFLPDGFSFFGENLLWGGGKTFVFDGATAVAFDFFLLFLSSVSSSTTTPASPILSINCTTCNTMG